MCFWYVWRCCGVGVGHDIVTTFWRLRRRLAVAAAAALFGAAISIEYSFDPLPPYLSDFSSAWAGARELRAGGNPYDVVGPGKPHPIDFPLLYPLPAVLFALPFSYLPMVWADAIFVALGAGALAWAITGARVLTPQLIVFGSMSYLTAAQVAQWSPLLTAGARLPTLGFVLACKPTIGAALWIAYPRLRSALLAAGLVCLSFVVWPSWVESWWSTLATARHLKAPITYWGGPLILLALWKWRLPEARLLVALACVPQTAVLYDVVPLFLVVRTFGEGCVLLMLCMGVMLARDLGAPYASYNALMAATGQWIVWLIYLPCLVILMRRELAGGHQASDATERRANQA